MRKTHQLEVIQGGHRYYSVSFTYSKRSQPSLRNATPAERRCEKRALAAHGADLRAVDCQEEEVAGFWAPLVRRAGEGGRGGSRRLAVGAVDMGGMENLTYYVHEAEEAVIPEWVEREDEGERCARRCRCAAPPPMGRRSLAPCVSVHMRARACVRVRVCHSLCPSLRLRLRLPVGVHRCAWLSVRPYSLP